MHQIRHFFIKHTITTRLVRVLFFLSQPSLLSGGCRPLSHPDMRSRTENLYGRIINLSVNFEENKKTIIIGRLTKFYPKFHLTCEFLTNTNILYIFKSHFTFEFLTFPARPRQFLTLCFNFSLCRRGRANFSLYVWISHFSSEALTFHSCHHGVPARRGRRGVDTPRVSKKCMMVMVATPSWWQQPSFNNLLHCSFIHSWLPWWQQPLFIHSFPITQQH